MEDVAPVPADVSDNAAVYARAAERVDVSMRVFSDGCQGVCDIASASAGDNAAVESFFALLTRTTDRVPLMTVCGQHYGERPYNDFVVFRD